MTHSVIFKIHIVKMIQCSIRSFNILFFGLCVNNSWNFVMQFKGGHTNDFVNWRIRLILKFVLIMFLMISLYSLRDVMITSFFRGLLYTRGTIRMLLLVGTVFNRRLDFLLLNKTNKKRKRKIGISQNC